MKHQSSTGKIVLKTALIVTGISVTVLVIFAVVIFLCFPYEGYKFADNMGMDELALKFAEQYAEDGHMDGLVYCIDLSDKLLDSKHSSVYAQKLKKYTQMFSERSGVNAYFDQLDSYYAGSSIDPIAKAGLYSYRDHVISKNYKARAFLGGDEVNYILFGDDLKVTALSDLIEETPVAGTDATTHKFKAELGLDMMDCAYIYSALCQQFLFDYGTVILDSTQEGTVYTPFGEAVYNSLAKYLGDINEHIQTNRDDIYGSFYLVRTAYFLINGMRYYMTYDEFSDDGCDWDFYLAAYTIMRDSGGAEMKLAETYYYMLNNYFD